MLDGEEEEEIVTVRQLLAMLLAVIVLGSFYWLATLGPRAAKRLRTWLRRHWQARATRHLMNMVRSGKAGL